MSVEQQEQLTYRTHNTDNAFFEQTGINIVSALAAACLLDDKRNKWHHEWRDGTAVKRAL